METALNRHYLRPLPNQHRLPPQNGGAELAMRLASLRRYTSNQTNTSPNRPSHLQILRVITLNNTMADGADRKNLPSDRPPTSTNVIDAKQEAESRSEKQEPEIPAPPEKPLPGDCCGSGCVRCVWDVYYEELEEYNLLCNSKSESVSNAKAS
ncbi:hypothetical protein RJ639_036255 [Escallonia herrerae]|uniref:Oxidoreductase-like domain-containing protein n=1 Tax=Escallonia herrerae TaxID=1293975 RepID=A0AA88WQY6_9ASTE|nr:hypothetical protein RJ639_036255 [Escallonia herrerae]